MFKSIFNKYIIVFLTIILVSFAILALIVANISRSYSENDKKESIRNASEVLKDYVEGEFHSAMPADLGSFVYTNYKTLRPTFSLIGKYENDLIMILTDPTGKILLSDKLIEEGYSNIVIPQKYVDIVYTTGSYSEITNMDGLFNDEYTAYGLPVLNRDSSFAGAVFALSNSRSITLLANLLAKTIITAMLWVMVIALLAVFVLSERISAPLRKTSKAVKEFTEGNFSSRVNIKGNDEVASLAQNVNAMADSIENLEKMRSTFLSNIAHDLRTPMTSISGFIDGILDGAIPPEKQEYYLRLVSAEVKRLSRLVSSLLDITKFESGEKKLNKTEFDVCEMARQIVISFEKKIEEKKLDVEFDTERDSIHVLADADAVYQVLYNICDNAVKFSREKGKYRVRIKTDGGKVFVSVYNEGKGISPEDIPFVFDRFYKSDKSRGLDRSGVGLGLYISKTIIEAHKEKIWAESVENEYCEFVFTLEQADK